MPNMILIDYMDRIQPYFFPEDIRYSNKSRIEQLIRWDQLHSMQWATYRKDHSMLKNAIEFSSEGTKRIMYVARAKHCGSITPGYVNQGTSVCYIPWGGKAHAKKEFEVLCTPGAFVPCQDTNTLLRATPAGVSEQGEPLYIGRVMLDRKPMIGKVQRSHNVCYISVKGKEVAMKDFEIFIKSGA